MLVLGAGVKTDSQGSDNRTSIVCPELFNEDTQGSVNSLCHTD